MNKIRTVFFYSHVIPSSTGSGARMRVFYNIKGYIMMGFRVELVLLNQNNYPENRIYEELGKNNFHIFKLDFATLKRVNESKKSFYDEKFLSECILNYLFKDRRILKTILIENIKKSKNAIHHFEYIQNASASVGLNGNFVWSNHDNVSKRLLIRGKISKKPKKLIEKVFTFYRYFLVRVAERIIIKNLSLIITISTIEDNHYKKYSFAKVKHFPFSIEDSRLRNNKNVIRNKNSKIFKILHLGSLDAMLPFQSMINTLDKVFPQIESENLSKIQLLVVGSTSDNFRSKKILKKAKKFKNIEILGFIDDLTDIWSQTDLHIIASEFDIGIRTKIIESLCMKVPVVCLKETASGIAGLKHLKNIIFAKSSEEIGFYINEIINGRLNIDHISTNGFLLYDKHYNFKNNLPIFKKYIQKYL
tara:strand:- start:1903 stop:3156 length:1254 start_codon:yes stop_codon:yes gene_type:complete